ncbi:MAG: LamG-like jellyroll fold domain-containing protein, partial [Bryobacteraceae bacterium]
MTGSVPRRWFLLGSAAGAGMILSAAERSVSSSELARWDFDRDGEAATDSISRIADTISSRTCKIERRPGIGGKALRLDGYSVWFSRAGPRAPVLGEEFTIQLWAALESFPVSDAAFINQHDRQDSGYFFGLDPYGFLRLELSVDGVWRQCVSTAPVPRYEWVHLAGSLERSGAMSVYQNGLRVGSAEGRGGGVRAANSVELIAGKTNGCPYSEGLFPTGVLNGLLDEVSIHAKPLTAAEIRQAHRRGSGSKQPDLAVANAEFKGDQHRPTYHALPPRAWTNEPHGLIRFQGQYHLFYQKNANGPYWGQINWGHMAGPDLMRWKHLRPALSPEPGLDAAGCWSGSVIEYKGQLAIIYTAVDGKKASICLATSNDGVSFSKSKDNPLIAGPPENLKHMDFRDPFVWTEGDSFYMIVGSGIREVGGTALLYKSSDLIQWTFLRQLLQGNKESSGTFWEMPVFVPLGAKHILIVTEVPGRSSYWIGEWKDERFYPEHEYPKRLEIVNHFLSPTPYRDEKGRMIAMGIIPETRSARETWKAGWAHVYSLPRILSLDEDGSLRQQPLPELQALRGKSFSIRNKRVESESSNFLSDVRGTALEISAKFTREDSTRVGLRLRRTADRQE